MLGSVTHHLQQCSELRSDVRVARRPHLVEGRHALERGPHRTDRRLRAPLADLHSHLLRQGSRSLQLLALRLHVRVVLHGCDGLHGAVHVAEVRVRWACEA